MKWRKSWIVVIEIFEIKGKEEKCDEEGKEKKRKWNWQICLF